MLSQKIESCHAALGALMHQVDKESSDVLRAVRANLLDAQSQALVLEACGGLVADAMDSADHIAAIEISPGQVVALIEDATLIDNRPLWVGRVTGEENDEQAGQVTLAKSAQG